MGERLLIFSDGGARGNPGPAAIAFIAQNEKGQTLKSDSRFIGVHTNNQAEYEALLLALKFALDKQAEEVICNLDSELVVKQLNGDYAVKSEQLRQLWQKIQQIKAFFKQIRFINVPREHPQIQRADALVNKALDEQTHISSKELLRAKQTETMGKRSMFVHVSIRTSNIDRSIDFYSRLLGLRLQSRRKIKQNNAEIAFLQDPEQKGCKLELTFYSNQSKFSQPNYEERLFDHLGFEVADINNTLDAMKKENVTVTDEPYEISPNTTIAFIEDPDGTLIELIEHK